VTGFILKARDRLLVSLVSTEVAIASGIGVTSLRLSSGVDPEVVWLKLQSLAEGARIASQMLW
jgi:hypothetical protein